MRSTWMDSEGFRLLLTALMPANRLVLETCLETGLRIGDVLSLKVGDLQKAIDRPNRRITVKEHKTGKTRRVRLPAALSARLMAQSGRVFVFEHRTDWRKHRNRTTVYKDLKRVVKLYRIEGRKVKGQISPHSARKIYAVEKFKRSTLEQLRRDLGHSTTTVTMLYALADRLQ